MDLDDFEEGYHFEEGYQDCDECECVAHIQATERLVDELISALERQVAMTAVIASRHGYDSETIPSFVSGGKSALALAAEWRKSLG